ncbi:hypothetical protein [Dictyobacter halimunensis]|uniref:hypothetical protein n=1 Tax=Dictyobacter halimunensis TaxID=3026934 RepID=UPI0030C7129C
MTSKPPEPIAQEAPSSLPQEASRSMLVPDKPEPPSSIQFWRTLSFVLVAVVLVLAILLGLAHWYHW